MFKSIPVLITVIFSLITILTTNFKYYQIECVVDYFVLLSSHIRKRKTYFNYSLRNMFCFDMEHICSIKNEIFCFGLRGKKFSKVEHFPRPCIGIELINICFISFYFPRPYSAKDELNGRFPRLSPYL